MNPRRWLHEHSLKLLAIRDTPEAIAGGVAIGIFFGFSALFGLKTVLTIFFAWLTRSNILAAVLIQSLAATQYQRSCHDAPVFGTVVNRRAFALCRLQLTSPGQFQCPWL